jgi:hypothetical protein
LVTWWLFEAREEPFQNSNYSLNLLNLIGMCLTSVGKKNHFFAQQVFKRMFGFTIEGYDTHGWPFVQAWLHRWTLFHESLAL